MHWLRGDDIAGHWSVDSYHIHEGSVSTYFWLHLIDLSLCEKVNKLEILVYVTPKLTYVLVDQLGIYESSLVQSFSYDAKALS
jgi:hypothetical protein